MKIYNKEKWEKVKLGEIFELQMGKTPSRNKENYWRHGENSWISISDMKNEEKYICDTKEKITDLAVEESKIKVIPKDTVIMSFKLSIGKLAITSKDMFTNEAIMAFFPKDKVEIDNNYLFYSLKKVNWTEGTNKAVKGLTLNKPLIASKEIFLPNMQIQKEIAKRLDIVMEILKIKRKILLQLDELSKCLFIKMFGDPILNEKKFKKGKIRDTIVEAKYGTSKPATIGGKYPYLRMNNITYNGELDLSDLKYITLEKNEEEKYLVEKGDILFNRTNSKELVGKTCVFNLNTPMVIAGYLIKLKVNKQVIPEYISAFLNSVHGKRRLHEMCRNIIGQANINAQELQDISILIPPIELQNQFAERVKMIEKSKFEIQKSIEETQKLFDSLMEKYFG